MLSRKGMGVKSASGTHHRFRWVLIIVFVSLVVVIGLASSLSLTHRAAAPPPSDQVLLQSSIVNDREHLFNGVLIYQPLEPTPVEQTAELDVELIGVGKDPAAVQIPAGNVVGSRSLQVGGVEGASLSARDRGVDISPVGPARGLIGQPGDKVNWTWDITSKVPGEHTLDLVVVTYQGTSDNPLFVVSPPVRIGLDITDTWSHRMKSMEGWIIGFGGFIVALAAIFAFFREQVFALLPKRKGKKEQSKETAPK